MRILFTCENPDDFAKAEWLINLLMRICNVQVEVTEKLHYGQITDNVSTNLSSGE